jgi:hypothetical protein
MKKLMSGLAVGPRGALAGAVLSLALCLPAAARADSPEGETSPGPRVRDTAASAGRGNFLFLSHGAAVDGQTAFGAAAGGYDGARGSALFEATAEVRVWGPVAVRGGAVYTGTDQRLRPTFGVRVQALREAAHGLDATLGAFYRPEGLTEPEGELEAVMAAGAHLGRTYLLGNLVYGQDPEGNERDGEVRLAAVAPIGSRLLLGFDGRLRFDLGSQAAGRAEPALDLMVGPTATVPLGRVALLLQGGASVVKAAAVGAGPFVLGGLGSSF